MLLNLLSALLFLKDGTFIGGLVLHPILLLNVLQTILAFVGLVSTLLNVVDPDFDPEDLFAILALLRLKLASFFMVPECDSRGRVWTVLALDRFVGRLLMLFSISLRHDIATLSTLVIVPGTANLVHPNLAHANVALASRADFGFFLSNFRHLYFR